jgi:hypothetical protein
MRFRHGEIDDSFSVTFSVSRQLPLDDEPGI